MELTISDAGQFKIIKPVGRIDWESARHLDQEIHRLIEEGFYHLVFNLDEVTFICSGGIGALAYNVNKVKRKGGAIYVISANDYINYVFETLKFNIVFDGFYFRTQEEFSAAVLEKNKQ
ncbi:MAG: STAS domain-containing protein [Chitinispirillaceae bacterium]|jgi:anti-anti-sigma factor|nr:STAS domain-containing protein [Chitinispirillaceae bacterium]